MEASTSRSSPVTLSAIRSGDLTDASKGAIAYSIRAINFSNSLHCAVIIGGLPCKCSRSRNENAPVRRDWLYVNAVIALDIYNTKECFQKRFKGHTCSRLILTTATKRSESSRKT